MREILRLISNSAGNVGTILKSVAEQAAHICQAQFVDILLVENDNLRDVAWFGELKRTLAFPLDRFTVAGRSVCEMRPVSVDDLQNAGDEFARGREIARKDGHRSILAVPLIRDGRAVGTIVIRRTEIQPFEQRHIALLTAFADQAVIAIENTRLLNELRESLQQQTATAEVLNVISRSAFDAQPVFETIIKNAAQLCQSVLSAVYRSDGELVHLVTHDQFSPESVAAVRAAYPVPIASSNLIAVAVRERRVVHIADVLVSGGYTELQRASGYRAILVVPMMRDDVAIGAIAVMQLEPRLFPDTQVELLKTFANQAVIAIDNVRLFNELRLRTDDLSESLQQQTATSDVLKVISRSAFDLKSVLQTLVESAGRLCGADYATITRQKDGVLFFAEAYGYSSEFIEYVKAMPVERGRGTATGTGLAGRSGDPYRRRLGRP